MCNFCNATFTDKLSKKIRPVNTSVWQVETATTIKEFSNAWNVSANIWLRYFVYMRLGEYSRVVRTFLTFIVSAFWHGFFPGYYLSFLTWPWMLHAERRLHKRFASSMVPRFCKVCFKIVAWAVTQLAIDYAALGFHFLLFRETLDAWSSLWWMHLILIFC